MAVEPRKIKQPSETETPSLAEGDVDVSEDSSRESEKKKGLPIIPILAGLVALVVLGLLGKVVFSK